MAAVWMRLRSELRSRLGATVALAVIAGLIGGIVIAAVVGARRTETAYARFLSTQRAADLIVTPDTGDGNAQRRAIERLPEVADTAGASLAGGQVELADGRVVRVPDIFPLISFDGRFGTELNRMKVLSGRLPDQSRANEAAVSFAVADQYGIHLGDTLRVGLTGEDPFQSSTATPKIRVPVRIVAIEAMPGEFGVSGEYLPGLHLTQAFARRYGRFILPDPTFAVRLRGGPGGVPSFRRELAHFHATQAFDIAQQTGAVDRATHVQASALWILAAIVAITGVAVFGQALARQTFSESIDHPALRAVGFSPGHLAGLAVARAAAVGAGAAAIGVGVSVALSPLAPTGVARAAEPNPGLRLDVWPTAIGAAAILFTVVLLSAFPAWRVATAARRAGRPGSEEAGRPSSLATLLARMRTPPPAAIGARMALEPGRGTAAVPVRTTMLGATFAAVAFAAALAFGASLHHLTNTPRLSGWNWDGILSGPHPVALAREAANREPVTGVALGGFTELRLDRTTTVDTLALDPLRGNMRPALVEGRVPTSEGEIALASRTARTLGVDIGDTVAVRTVHDDGPVGPTVRLRIVGRIALPTFFFSLSEFGEGAAVAPAELRRIDPNAFRSVNIVFLRLAPGARFREVGNDLQRRIGSVALLPPTENGQIRNLSEIGDVPLLLATIVALMAAATLGHTMLTSIRRRRRDLAILKTLGFLRRQVSWTVATQATTLVIVALAVGLPLGVAAGRWSWNMFADQFGAVPEAVVPLGAVMLLLPAAIAVANLIALVPGRMASRVRAAAVLRAE